MEEKRQLYVPVKEAISKGFLPVSLRTIYRWHQDRRHPRLITKIGGKLYVNMKEYTKLTMGS